MNKEGMKCLIYGGDLCWDSDFDLSEVRDAPEGDGGIISVYHCKDCGRDYEISDPVKEERETTYKNYWHGTNV